MKKILLIIGIIITVSGYAQEPQRPRLLMASELDDPVKMKEHAIKEFRYNRHKRYYTPELAQDLNKLHKKTIKDLDKQIAQLKAESKLKNAELEKVERVNKILMPIAIPLIGLELLAIIILSISMIRYRIKNKAAKSGQLLFLFKKSCRAILFVYNNYVYI